MLKRIFRIQKDVVDKLIWLIIPLECISFFYDSDSLPGKGILLAKLFVIGFCYLLFVKDIPVRTHVMIAIAAVSMAISSWMKGGIGVTLIVLTLFMALAVLPRIILTEKQRGLLFFLLGIGALIAVLSGLTSNISLGNTFFDFTYSRLNSNEYGVLFLSAAFYFVSAVEAFANKRNNRILIPVICCAFVVLILLTRCRSALLAMAVFAFAWILFSVGKRTDWMYTPIVAFSVLFVLAVVVLSKLTGLGVSDGTREIYRLRVFGKELMSSREVLWSNAIDGYLLDSIWGAGSKWLMDEVGLSSAHNVYLGLLVTMGLFPSLVYTRLILSDDASASFRPETGASGQVAKLCFMASIAVAAFECSFTDSRFNFLFLPLLISSQSSSTAIDRKDPSMDSTAGRVGQSGFRFSWLIIFAVSLLLVFCYSKLPSVERWIVDNTGDPMEESVENLLGDPYNKKRLYNAVSWELDEDTVTVYGTASGTSFYRYYDNSEKMPDWYIPGHSYRLQFHSDVVTFRVLYYNEAGDGHWIFGTHGDETFVIPEQAQGLLIDMLLFPHEQAHEKVRPILYDETLAADKRIE